MHSLGISVYPDKSDIKEVYEYMETAAKLGFSRIFTCFLSIPDDKRESYIPGCISTGTDRSSAAISVSRTVQRLSEGSYFDDR